MSGRRKSHKARRHRPYCVIQDAPTAVTAAFLDGLLVPRPSWQPGMPTRRASLQQFLPLIRGACTLAGGHLVKLQTDGSDYEWCVIAGRAVHHFGSLRQVCQWARARLDAAGAGAYARPA